MYFDPLTVQVKTSTPMPLLVEQIGDVFILSGKAAQSLDSTAMNTGKGMIGTGPYIFQRWAPGQLLEMKANPAYWGGKPAWDKVTLKFIPGGASRVAALLSGNVDLIDQLAPADAGKWASTPRPRCSPSPRADWSISPWIAGERKLRSSPIRQAPSFGRWCTGRRARVSITRPGATKSPPPATPGHFSEEPIGSGDFA
jgi:Bacterial extracellular solute-binding proteins, family 5 Middle